MDKLFQVFTMFALFFLPVSQAEVATDYGNNIAAGAYIEVDDIKLYYEIYGVGEPLLLIHGNGQAIASMKQQIEHFSSDHQVVVVDSRGHGKSGLGSGRLTYIQMMEDYNALLEHLSLQQVKVFGWSDGGIISLLLAIHHPEKVAKIAVMGANLRPDQTAIESWVPGLMAPVSEMIDEMIASNDKSTDWHHQRQLVDILITQPDISHAQLQSIEVPTLLVAGDMDIIRGEHTIEMFRNLPNAHLAILPGQTHWAPETDPEGFNALLGRFFKSPFTRPTSQELLERDLNGH